MVTTTWIAGSGDWNTTSNWSNGVPTASDDAVFSTIPGTRPSTTYTVTGNGVAASLLVGADNSGAAPVLAGTYTLGTFADNRPAALFADDAVLAATADLRFGSATISGGAILEVATGARLEGGTLTLAGGVIQPVNAQEPGSSGLLAGSTIGTLDVPLALAGTGTILGGAVLSGPVGGPGVLRLDGGTVLLDSAGTSIVGGLQIGALNYGGLGEGTPVVEVAQGSVGPVLLGSGALTLDPGVTVGPVTAAVGFTTTLTLTDQATTVFAGQFALTVNNGAGHATVIGATAPAPELYGEGPEIFGTMTVNGGVGSVTVFGGDSGGLFQGGTAGHNVLVGGADLTGYTGLGQGGASVPRGTGYVSAPGVTFANQPDPVTLHGGGDGDLLVEAGTYNGQANILIAGAGAETLTGSGSSANGFFYGGTGADLIALGGGYSVVVAGSGVETIAGGAGTAAIFVGSGQDVILGGAGADYVQAGAGNATLFAGAGADLIGAVDGQSGGSLVVSGFRIGTDRLDLQGYGGGMSGITNSQVVNGSTALTLVDGTHVTLLGVTNLGTSSFV